MTADTPFVRLSGLAVFCGALMLTACSAQHPTPTPVDVGKLPICGLSDLRFSANPVSGGDLGVFDSVATFTAVPGRTCRLAVRPSATLEHGGKSVSFPVPPDARKTSFPLVVSANQGVIISANVNILGCSAADRPPTIRVSEPGWTYVISQSLPHCTLDVGGVRFYAVKDGRIVNP